LTTHTQTMCEKPGAS